MLRRAICLALLLAACGSGDDDQPVRADEPSASTTSTPAPAGGDDY